MSDELDVTAESSTADVTAEPSPAPDFEAMFGLEPEPATEPAPKVAEEVTLDDPEVADPPVPHQEEEVKDAPPEEAPAEEDSAFKFNEKLNWDDGPESQKQFRAEYKALKQEYLRNLENSVESQFINNPQDFAKWMEEASPTSFNELGALLTTRSAQEAPQAWVDYLLANNPDLLAEKVSGREGMTLERLKGELSFVLDEDDEAVQAALDKFKVPDEAAKTEETPEQKEIREWRQERAQAKHQEVVNEVFQPIENAVNDLVSQAGLEIKPADYQGKKFEDLDEETRFKVLVNDVVIPNAIEYYVQNDPKLVSMQKRLQDFIAQGDVTSAKALQHQAQIVATNAVAATLEALTGQRAKAKTADTLPPVKEPPKTMVKGAGAAASLPTGMPTADDWRVTDADLG